jgi:hypothetical protein
MDSSVAVKNEVRQKYGEAARAVSQTGSVQACCDPGLRCCDPITTNLYTDGEKALIPEKAVLASLGCGNPTALIELKPGEVVLDLGSGGFRRRASSQRNFGISVGHEVLIERRHDRIGCFGVLRLPVLHRNQSQDQSET